MPTRAALCSGGSGCLPFPSVLASMQPSDFPSPFGRGSGYSLPLAYRHRTLFLCRYSACASQRGPVGDSLTGSPLAGLSSRKRWDLPGYCVVPLRACRGRTPRRSCHPRFALCGGDPAAFGNRETLGCHRIAPFAGCLPTAHSLAHLRIALALPLLAQGSLPACRAQL